ncbi:MAG: thiamine-monophosphate kinase [Cryomorphaceae bacterium]
MAEFSLIERFCQGIGPEHKATKLGIGDDAAVITVPDNMELAVSVDTMVEGVHFYPDAEPAHIAHKLFAVNLSDMAAMGANPKWATLTLTLPNSDLTWLASFSESLNAIACKYGVQLIGGDTSRGTLNLSLHIMGLLPKGKAMCRSKARVGDDVYVSNTLGDAALALKCTEGVLHFRGSQLDNIMPALNQPEPQVDLGLGLLNIANACIDVSDGVVADLSHVAKQSDVSIELNVERIPVSAEYKQHLSMGGTYDLALGGGDDYELAFTAVRDRRGELLELAQTLGVKLTKIGRVTKTQDLAVSMSLNGEPYHLAEEPGYQHFSGIS